MKYAAFKAVSPYEIGDRVIIQKTMEAASLSWKGHKTIVFGTEEHTITDIMCSHFLKTGEVVFSYELDNSGRYVKLANVERMRSM